MLPFAELDPTIVGALITALLGGGTYAGLRVVKTAGPEAGAISVRSVVEANTELRTELDRQGKLITQLREQNDRHEQVIREQDVALTRAEGRIRALTQELSDLEDARDERGA
jgi:hypothetical protein